MTTNFSLYMYMNNFTSHIYSTLGLHLLQYCIHFYMHQYVGKEK